MTDLPDLMKTHPMGVTFSDLYDYYKESEQRIAKAVILLLEDGRINRERKTGGMYYIYPKDYNLPRPHPELTHNQYLLLKRLWELRKPNESNVRTNYSRLAEELHISIGGTKAALQRLALLDYIKEGEPYSKDLRFMTFEILVPAPWDQGDVNALPPEEDDHE